MPEIPHFKSHTDPILPDKAKRFELDSDKGRTYSELILESAKWSLDLSLIRRYWHRLESGFPSLLTAYAIRVISLEVSKNPARVGQVIRLRCKTSNEKLFSLSWSKNGQEFYRFQPHEKRQPLLFFNLTGVSVDVSYPNIIKETFQPSDDCKSS